MTLAKVTAHCCHCHRNPTVQRRVYKNTYHSYIDTRPAAHPIFSHHGCCQLLVQLQPQPQPATTAGTGRHRHTRPPRFQPLFAALAATLRASTTSTCTFLQLGGARSPAVPFSRLRLTVYIFLSPPSFLFKYLPRRCSRLNPVVHCANASVRVYMGTTNVAASSCATSSGILSHQSFSCKFQLNSPLLSLLFALFIRYTPCDHRVMEAEIVSVTVPANSGSCSPSRLTCSLAVRCLPFPGSTRLR